jgi:hypothetical protein
MGVRSAELLLKLWECGRHCRQVERSVCLLATALPEHDFEALSEFDLGLRDWHLLRLRRDLFGAMLAGYIDCPSCCQRLEIELDANVLQGEHPPEAELSFTTLDGRRFRLPNSRDLAAILEAPNTATAARQLLGRCRLDGFQSDDELNGVFEEVDAGLEALAAQRALHLDLSCASCGQQWQHVFDPGEFLWEEIESQAALLLDDVHRLASAYGWTERDILAMSDERRAAYVSRVD